MGQDILVEVTDGIARVRIDHAPVNAMTIELTEQIAEVFRELAGQDDVTAIILTGTGKSFCAGLDLKIVPHLDGTMQNRLLDALNNAFLAVYECPVPVVGAINGHAIAGGMVLALCCDWRIAADWPFQAGVTEVRAGIPYPVGAIEVTRTELRPEVGREMILFGRNISQPEAVRRGVFDQSVPAESLMMAAMEKATELSQLPRHGFRTVKHQLRRQPLAEMRAAVEGAEPLYDNWLSEETMAAATSVLQG